MRVEVRRLLRDYGTMTMVEVLYENDGGWEVQGNMPGSNG